MHAIATLIRLTGIAAPAVVDGIDPTRQAGLFRLAPEKVQILLAHEIFSRVERIRALARVTSGEGSLDAMTKRAEALRLRAETIVRARGHDGIEAVRLDIVEVIVAQGVGDGQTILRPTYP